MIFYPKIYLDSVKNITVELLEKYKIKGLILDVDNTLIDYDKKMPDGTEEWVKELKTRKIQLCILSNSNHQEKVEKVANQLAIPYFYFAKKPLKSGFRKIQKLFQLKPENIGVVGDQILTDVIGANRNHMISILVKPIAEKDIWITKLKRPIENKIMQKYQKNREK